MRLMSTTVLSLLVYDSMINDSLVFIGGDKPISNFEDMPEEFTIGTTSIYNLSEICEETKLNPLSKLINYLTKDSKSSSRSLPVGIICSDKSITKIPISVVALAFVSDDDDVYLAITIDRLKQDNSEQGLENSQVYGLKKVVVFSGLNYQQDENDVIFKQLYNIIPNTNSSDSIATDSDVIVRVDDGSAVYVDMSLETTGDCNDDSNVVANDILGDSLMIETPSEDVSIDIGRGTWVVVPTPYEVARDLRDDINVDLQLDETDDADSSESNVVGKNLIEDISEASSDANTVREATTDSDVDIRDGFSHSAPVETLVSRNTTPQRNVDAYKPITPTKSSSTLPVFPTTPVTSNAITDASKSPIILNDDDDNVDEDEGNEDDEFEDELTGFNDPNTVFNFGRASSIVYMSSTRITDSVSPQQLSDKSRPIIHNGVWSAMDEREDNLPADGQIVLPVHVLDIQTVSCTNNCLVIQCENDQNITGKISASSYCLHEF